MNQIEKKAAEWDGVVDAVQDSSSRRERLDKRLIYLQDYLQKYDDVSEQIYNRNCRNRRKTGKAWRLIHIRNFFGCFDIS